MSQQQLNIKNKKASFEYEFIDKYVCGMSLQGTEIKSIRAGKASITEAYCYVRDHELFIKNMHIAEYEMGSYNNHHPLRERKLLLNRIELDKIEKKLKVQGITIVALRVFLNEKGWAKMEIAVARGKKLHDKRESIKERDVKRDLDRLKKY